MKKDIEFNLDHQYMNGKGPLVNTISISDEAKVALDAMIDSIEYTTGNKANYNALIMGMIEVSLSETENSEGKSIVLDKLNTFHMNQFK